MEQTCLNPILELIKTLVQGWDLLRKMAGIEIDLSDLNILLKIECFLSNSILRGKFCFPMSKQSKGIMPVYFNDKLYAHNIFEIKLNLNQE